MSTAREQFIEQMGLIAQSDGTPRIAGHILGYLIVEGEARTLNQMTEALKISKASASTNARLLELRGAIRRTSPMGQRQVAYEALGDPGLQMLESMVNRFRANADLIDAITRGFAMEDDGARGRVANVAEFYRNSAQFIEEWFTRMGPSASPETCDSENE